MIELKNIRHWVFDLDNTLYPNTTNLFSKIDVLMCKFIEDNLRVSSEEALSIKDTYFHEHGTTLNGLMKNHKIDAEEFLEFVHNIDYSLLQKDLDLANEIKKLPGEKIIFTNDKLGESVFFTDNITISRDYFLEASISWILENYNNVTLKQMLCVECETIGFGVAMSEDKIWVVAKYNKVYKK